MNNKLNIIKYHYVIEIKKNQDLNLKAQSVHIFRKQLNFMKKIITLLNPSNLLNL